MSFKEDTCLQFEAFCYRSLWKNWQIWSWTFWSSLLFYDFIDHQKFFSFEVFSPQFSSSLILYLGWEIERKKSWDFFERSIFFATVFWTALKLWSNSKESDRGSIVVIPSFKHNVYINVQLDPDICRRHTEKVP